MSEHDSVSEHNSEGSELKDIEEIAAPLDVEIDVAPPPDEEALLDSSGVVFDPEQHATKRDGSPSYTKSGRFRKLRRPNGSARAAVDPTPENQKYRAAAEGTVAAVEMLGMMIGGDAFRYVKDKKARIDERAAGIDAWTSYYEARDIEDIPPGLVVAIWAIAYAAPRFGDPSVRKRFGSIGAKVGKALSRARKWFRKK